jgi:hypothetical protein
VVFTFVATAFDPIVVVVAAAAATAVVGKPLEVTTAATVEEEQERETVWFFFLIAIDGFVTQVAGSVNESCEEFPAVTTDEDPGETELEAEVAFCDRCTTGLIDARVFDAVSTAAEVVAEGRADLWAPIIAVVDPFFRTILWESDCAQLSSTFIRLAGGSPSVAVVVVGGGGASILLLLFSADLGCD